MCPNTMPGMLHKRVHQQPQKKAARETITAKMSEDWSVCLTCTRAGTVVGCCVTTTTVLLLDCCWDTCGYHSDIDYA